jgi:hypothetical protein
LINSAFPLRQLPKALHRIRYETWAKAHTQARK